MFFFAGANKWNPFAENGTLNPAEGLKDVAQWFGNPDWGLGLPVPLLMAVLAWASEDVGNALFELAPADEVRQGVVGCIPGYFFHQVTLGRNVSQHTDRSGRDAGIIVQGRDPVFNFVFDAAITT